MFGSRDQANQLSHDLCRILRHKIGNCRGSAFRDEHQKTIIFGINKNYLGDQKQIKLWRGIYFRIFSFFLGFFSLLASSLLASWLLGFLASWLLGFSASWLLGFLASWLLGFSVSRLRGFLAFWLLGFLVFGLLAFWLFGFLASRLLGF